MATAQWLPLLPLLDGCGSSTPALSRQLPQTCCSISALRHSFAPLPFLTVKRAVEPESDGRRKRRRLSNATPKEEPIRRVRVSDVAAVQEMQDTSYSVVYPRRFYQALFYDQGTVSLVYAPSPHLPAQGFISARLLPGPNCTTTLYILSLVVDGAHRRQGIATRLFQALVQAALDLHPNPKGEVQVCLHVEAANEARKLYKKLGMEELRAPGYYRGRDGFKMEGRMCATGRP